MRSGSFLTTETAFPLVPARNDHILYYRANSFAVIKTLKCLLALVRRAIINLTELETEKTHKIYQDLEDNAGMLLLLVTISGMTTNKYQVDQTGKTMDDACRQDIVRRYVSACLQLSFIRLANYAFG